MKRRVRVWVLFILSPLSAHRLAVFALAFRILSERVFRPVLGVNIVVSGDVEALTRGRKESAIIIANHQSNADWAVIFMLAARHSPEGALEALRFMVKHSIQYMPLFGWYIFQHGYIFVRRAAFDASPVVRQLTWLNTLSTPFWLLIFPEGTRRRPSSLEVSRKFREAKGLPPLERVLSPRTAGMQLSLHHLTTASVIYDVTIAYSQESPPGMFGFVCCAPGSSVYVDVRRRKRAEAEGRVAEFLEESFRRKEELLTEYAASHASGGAPLATPATCLPAIPIAETGGPAALFAAALAAPFYFPAVRYALQITVGLSPALLLWLKLNKCV